MRRARRGLRQFPLGGGAQLLGSIFDQNKEVFYLPGITGLSESGKDIYRFLIYHRFPAAVRYSSDRYVRGMFTMWFGPFPNSERL